MKIAFCFSGQIRTGVYNQLNIKNFIGDLWNDCDFFVYTWDIETYFSPKHAKKLALDAGIKSQQPYPVNKKTISDFYALYNPRTMVVNDYVRWRSINGADPNMYCVRKSYELFEHYRNSNNINYDYVVITRPDALFDKSKNLQEDIDQVDDEKTFCYARLFDSENNIEHLESIYWLSKPFTMDIVSQFQYVIENRHPSKLIDGFIHLGIWISEGLRLNLKRLKNNKTAIYRWEHYEKEISPLDDWKNFQI